MKQQGNGTVAENMAKKCILFFAPYYDPLTSRMLTEDPIRDGLNWYTYCGNNPIRFFDPSGLVAVDVEEYYKTYDGATIRYSGNDSTVDGIWISYDGNELFFSFYTDRVDGRYIADDSLFVNTFGIGTNSIVVFDCATTGNISIRAAFNISGTGADNALDSSTYRAEFLAGIKGEWENSTTGVYVAESSKGIKINIGDGGGTSNVQYGLFGWSPSNPGKMTIYTGFSDDTTRTAQQFRYTVAHEFGHILGLGDAYESVAGVNPTASNDMMRWAEAGRNVTYQVSDASRRGAVTAYSKKKFQKAWW